MPDFPRASLTLGPVPSAGGGGGSYALRGERCGVFSDVLNQQNNDSPFTAVCVYKQPPTRQHDNDRMTRPLPYEIDKTRLKKTGKHR